MQRENLPIWRTLQQLLLQVEISVKSFSRYNKYTLGSELRQSALQCSRLLVRVLNSAGKQRQQHVADLQAQCDDLKVLLQLGKELQVFSSFRQFQQLVELAVGAGKQVGQWHRSLQKQCN